MIDRLIAAHAKIAELESQLYNVTLQRDILILNRETRDSQVITWHNDADMGVAWPDNQSATDKLINFPTYYKG